MNIDPVVSVCIPTYRRPDLLREAITSVLSQSDQRFEIIVFDDGPSADTFAVVDGFSDDRIRYVPTEKNLRPPASWNAAVRLAIAPYVLLLPDDDWLGAEFISRMVPVLEAMPDVAFAQCEVVEHSDSGEFRRPFLPAATLRGETAIEWQLSNLRCVPVSVLFRRSAMEALGLWREDYWDDWAFIVRLAYRYGFTYLPERMSHLRVHPANLHKMLHSERRDSILDQINQLNDIFGTALPVTPRLERLRSKLERNLSFHSALLALGAARRRDLKSALFHFARARRLNALVPFDPGVARLALQLRSARSYAK